MESGTPDHHLAFEQIIGPIEQYFTARLAHEPDRGLTFTAVHGRLTARYNEQPVQMGLNVLTANQCLVIEYNSSGGYRIVCRFFIHGGFMRSQELQDGNWINDVDGIRPSHELVGLLHLFEIPIDYSGKSRWLTPT